MQAIDIVPGDWPEATESAAQAAVPQARTVWESIVTDFTNHGFETEEQKREGDHS